jgi:hypothetical protein
VGIESDELSVEIQRKMPSYKLGYGIKTENKPRRRFLRFYGDEDVKTLQNDRVME